MPRVNAFDGLELFDATQKTREQIDLFARVIAANFDRRDNLFIPLDRPGSHMDSVSSFWIKSDDLTVYVNAVDICNGGLLPSLRKITDFDRQSTADALAYFLDMHGIQLRHVPYTISLDEDRVVVQDQQFTDDDE